MLWYCCDDKTEERRRQEKMRREEGIYETISVHVAKYYNYRLELSF
jgi:hypothetical protein